MKVLLVNPPRFEGIGVIREDRCENVERNIIHPPVSLVYLFGILQGHGHRVFLLDMNAMDLTIDDLRAALRRRHPEVVIFRSTPSTFFHDCMVAKMCNEQGLETIMLNWNLSTFSAKALQLEDSVNAYVTSYSYEHTIPEMLDNDDYYNVPGVTFRDCDTVIENPVLKRPRRVGDIPSPPWGAIEDHSIFFTRAKAISPWGVVRGSKGCGFQCTMCSDCNIAWDPRSPDLVVDEVERLEKVYGVKYITFFDNTFTINRDWAYAVADDMINRDLSVKWFMNTRPDVIDEEMVRRLKEANLSAVNLGAEAGTDEMLVAIKKGFTVQQTRDAIEVLKGNDVKVFLALMMGMPGETKEQMNATKDLVLGTRPHGFQLNIVTPYPGTPLYDECILAGKITPGLSWDAMSCVPTGLKETVSLAAISTDELIAFRQQLYWQMYLSPRYLLPNIWWTFTHLEDLKIAFSYVTGLAKNLWNRGAYTH